MLERMFREFFRRSYGMFLKREHLVVEIWTDVGDEVIWSVPVGEWSNLCHEKIPQVSSVGLALHYLSKVLEDSGWEMTHLSRKYRAQQDHNPPPPGPSGEVELNQGWGGLSYYEDLIVVFTRYVETKEEQSK